jgi:hypothetical protein
MVRKRTMSKLYWGFPFCPLHKEANDDLRTLAAVNDGYAVARRRVRTAMVLLGMALFAVGFLILLMAVTPADEASLQRYSDESQLEASESSSSGPLVLVGLVMSAAGLLVATLMPAVSFWSSSKSGR